MSSRPISIRLADSTICQMYDTLEAAGVQTANMPLASVARLLIEGTCRRAVKQGIARVYSAQEARVRLEAQIAPEFGLDFDEGFPTVEGEEVVIHNGAAPYTTPPLVAHESVDAQEKRTRIEKYIQPFVEQAVDRMEQERFDGVIGVSPSTPSSSVPPPRIIKAPWADVQLYPAAGLASLSGASEYARSAVSDKDPVRLITLMIAMPNIPDGVLGSTAGERLFLSVEKQIRNYLAASGDALPDPYQL